MVGLGHLMESSDNPLKGRPKRTPTFLSEDAGPDVNHANSIKMMEVPFDMPNQQTKRAVDILRGIK